MRNIHKRITALEAKTGPRATRWRRISVDGQSQADALAAHEAQNGPIGTDGVIYRVIVDPIGIAAGGLMQ